MPRLIRGGAVVQDGFVVVREAAGPFDLPDGDVIVPLALWQSHREVLRARGRVGVWLAPADDPVALAGDLDRLPVVAVDFPAFTDGRGYSHARSLRERHGYKGELRAIGDVQRDQLYYLAQVGFDAFAMADGRDADAALAGLRDFSDGYQSTHARTPWFRRREALGGAR
ncbi:MAG: DUF934 domain-containing protein [Burkholderiales bacterium]